MDLSPSINLLNDPHCPLEIVSRVYQLVDWATEPPTPVWAIDLRPPGETGAAPVADHPHTLLIRYPSTYTGWIQSACVVSISLRLAAAWGRIGRKCDSHGSSGWAGCMAEVLDSIARRKTAMDACELRVGPDGPWVRLPPLATARATAKSRRRRQGGMH